MKILINLLLLIPSLSWGDYYHKQIPQYLLEDFEIIFYDSHTVDRNSFTEVIEIYTLQRDWELVTCYNTALKDPVGDILGLSVKCYPHGNDAIEKIE